MLLGRGGAGEGRMTLEWRQSLSPCRYRGHPAVVEGPGTQALGRGGVVGGGSFGTGVG